MIFMIFLRKQRHFIESINQNMYPIDFKQYKILQLAFYFFIKT